MFSNIFKARISLLKQLSSFVPINIQKIFYQSYILPIIDYGSISWGSTSNTNIERINKLQKRAARIILKADFLTPSTDMFQQLGWMTVASRINYNKAIFTYKALNNLILSYISELLKPATQTHNRNLRSSENGSLTLPKANTVLYSGSFSYSAPKFWNTLPTPVRISSSLNIFKRSIKEHIQS